MGTMKKAQKGGNLGMKSVKAGFDKNPGVTRADIIVAAKGQAKKGVKVKKAQTGKTVNPKFKMDMDLNELKSVIKRSGYKSSAEKSGFRKLPFTTKDSAKFEKLPFRPGKDSAKFEKMKKGGSVKKSAPKKSMKTGGMTKKCRYGCK